MYTYTRKGRKKEESSTEVQRPSYAFHCPDSGKWESRRRVVTARLVPAAGFQCPLTTGDKGAERCLGLVSSWTILEFFCHAYTAFSVAWNSEVQPEEALRAVSPDTMGTDRFFGDPRQNDDGTRGQEQGVPVTNKCRSSLKSAKFSLC